MKKKLSLILGAAFVCSLANAQVYGDDEKDYIKYSQNTPVVLANDNAKPFFSGQEKFHLSSFSSNWFVSVKSGVSIFNGVPLGCDDMFGRIKYMFSASAGKWHSRFFGTRIAYQGFNFDNCNGESMDYQNLHVDILYNLSSYYRDSYATLPRWDFIPYVGAGIMRNSTVGNRPFALSYGAMVSYRVADRVHVTAELGGTSTFQHFDGVGKEKHFGDDLFQASIGLTVDLGKQGYEAKKSLGVLNTGDMGTVTDLTRYPKNDYKGLNDLRKRLSDEEAARLSQNNGYADGIKSPILFFFKINSTNLVDKQQKVEIGEIAAAVNKYDLKVRIVGAADSKTGKPGYNRKLSVKRARYIAKLLMRAGVSKDRMTGSSQGGINIYKPYTANRHTCVILYK